MKRAIVTAAFGAHERIASLTGQTLGDYCKRLNAQLVVFRGEKDRALVPGPHWIKTVAAGLFSKGCEELAWIDSDAIISPKAPSIFEVAAGQFAAFPESSRLTRLDNFREYLRLVFDARDPQVDKYYNSGVMVIPASAACVLQIPPKDELALTMKLRREHPEKFFHDQDWINSRIHFNQIKPVALPLEFNFMPFADVWEKRHAAHIIHYAGWYAVHGNGLLEIIRNDMRRWGIANA